MLVVNSFFVVKGILNNFRLVLVKKYKAYKMKKDMKNALKNMVLKQSLLKKKLEVKEEKKQKKREENKKRSNEILQALTDPIFAV